ncbi:MAG: CapA family protein, partial [Vicinamibacteraceae bacterium]
QRIVMTKRDVAISLAVVGDLSFEGPRADRPASKWFTAVAPAFRETDLAIGNLESPLVEGGTAIPGKCTLRGTTKWAAVLREAGIGLVTLANNHTMDYGETGLRSTIAALEKEGLQYVGAGLDIASACAPVLLDVRGVRVACLGRTIVPVSPPIGAGRTKPGVAFLDRDETVASLRRCRRDADLVLLLLHWGLEQYRHPSPAQRRLARDLVQAGADAIVGHHPHVTQGFERIGSAVVAYSLGNFIFSGFEWEYLQENGTPVKTTFVLSEENRKGLVLEVSGSAHRSLALRLQPTRMHPDDGVQLDIGATRSEEMQALSSALERKSYRLWWYAYAIRREWALRIGRTLSPRRLVTKWHRLRLRHLGELLVSLRRSTKIVSERSTNPYE